MNVEIEIVPNILTLLNNTELELRRNAEWIEHNLGLPPKGIFSAVAIDAKYCKLLPYPEFAIFLFRGQDRFHDPCCSSLYREKLTAIQRFAERVRNAEFELLLKNHPAVRDVSHASIYDHLIKIDYGGLVQHYGLKTDLIDFTSDPWVAAFFACCRFNKETGGYEPVMQADGYGVFYKFDFSMSTMISMGQKNSTEFGSRVVGLQPLPRPGEQSAFSYRLGHKQCLNKQKLLNIYKFQHNAQASIKIYEKFEGGKILFPPDLLEEKVEYLKILKSFSKRAFDIAFERYSKTDKKLSMRNDLLKAGYSLTEKNVVAFSPSEMDFLQTEWQNKRNEFFSKIIARRARSLSECQDLNATDDALAQ